MFEVEPIVVDHKDVIHDVVFDYYGRRMATCSSDQTVKVSDQRFIEYSECSDLAAFLSSRHRYGMKMNKESGQ